MTKMPENRIEPQKVFNSVNEWNHHYNLDSGQTELFSATMKDPDTFGAKLAESTIDRIIRERVGSP